MWGKFMMKQHGKSNDKHNTRSHCQLDIHSEIVFSAYIVLHISARQGSKHDSTMQLELLVTHKKKLVYRRCQNQLQEPEVCHGYHLFDTAHLLLLLQHSLFQYPGGACIMTLRYIGLSHSWNHCGRDMRAQPKEKYAEIFIINSIIYLLQNLAFARAPLQ